MPRSTAKNSRRYEDWGGLVGVIWMLGYWAALPVWAWFLAAKVAWP